MRNPERAHHPTSRARHAHEHPCAQSRGERRSHARDTAHKPRTALVPTWPRPRKGRPGKAPQHTSLREGLAPTGGRRWLGFDPAYEGLDPRQGGAEGFEKASREAVSPPTSSCEGGAHLAPGAASPRCSRSTGLRFAARITALRARDRESERFRQRSTWRSGCGSEGRSPANKGHATR